jgi:hypothetical protein
MTGRIRAFVGKYIVADVPPELSACLDCGFEQCLNEKWATCPARLAVAAALKDLQQASVARHPETETADSASATPAAGTAGPRE